MEKTKEIQYLNKVELTGRVGAVRTTHFSAVTLCRFTLATQRAYRDNEDASVEEVSWHDVHLFVDKSQESPSIQKGDAVHVTGSIRMYRYTDVHGTDRVSPEIIASSVENYGSETKIVPEEI